MRLSTYVQRIRALGDAKVPTTTLDLLGEKIAKGADLAGLLQHKNTVLSPRVLLGVWRSAQRLAAHMAYLERITARRREKGLPVIAPAMLLQTLSAHEVAVLERAEAMVPRGSVAEHRRRDAIKEAITLWKACLVLARREGTLTIERSSDDPELLANYGHLSDTTTLAEIDGPHWREIRRGMDEGALEIDLDVPMERLIAQVRARGTELHAVQGSQTVQDLVRSLILVDLDEWSYALKDEQANMLAQRQASADYLEILTTERPNQALYAGVWFTGGQASVCIVTRDGVLVEHMQGPLGDNPVAGVEQLIGTHAVEAVVLPTIADDVEALEALAEAFGANLEVFSVAPAAMAESVALIEDEAPDHVLLALVLVQRVVWPMKFWGQLDPLSLGLADHQEELDESQLRAALTELRTLAEAGVSSKDLSRPAPVSRAPKASAKPLNPLVKSVDDLRPGLEVNGLVTNITQFGAFINIGLSHEGLVHVSELADHFVNDPNEVVKVGQAVSARVLGVDRARRRISLSLRPDRAPGGPQRSDEEGAPVGDGKGGVRLDDIPGQRGSRRHSNYDRTKMGPGGNATGASREYALAELEALFKAKKGGG
jgi:predicted RNA-binding protein with RPS1 domain